MRTLRPSGRSRPRSRPRVELLEFRTLMSVAGTLDPSFDTGGVATYPAIPVALAINSQLYAGGIIGTAIQPDGKTLVAAVSNDPYTGSPALLVERLNRDGTPDSTFGRDGLASDPAASSGGGDGSVLVSPDGSISVVTAGTVDSVVRFRPDGSVDTSFGDGGEVQIHDPGVRTHGGPAGTTATVQPDGKLLIIHGSGVSRLDIDGALDTSFGQGGTVTDPIARDVEYFSVAVESGGRILLIGNLAGGGDLVAPFSNGADNQNVVVGLNPDGSVDPTYGSPATPGVAYLAVAVQGHSVVEETNFVASAIGPDDKLVILGSGFVAGSSP